MTMRHWIAGGVGIAALAAVGIWQGSAWFDHDRAEASATAAAPIQSTPSPRQGGEATAVQTVSDGNETIVSAGATPMGERVAVIGLLNKRNGESRDLKLRPGQAVRVGDAIVRLRACERTAPWETEQYTGAFVQLDVEGSDRRWRRAFSGWLYAERPSLNVVEHPIYDVWPKSCTMSRPETGPDTVVLGKDGAAPKAGAAPKRSSAPQSASTDAAPVASPAEDAPSAEDSNAE
ncbi:hypothetical protein FHT01_001972 [Sphingomonas japonica]|uniref:DUF2155 domain-containing protein n=1 Tax=Sphingomonas japonica TaxID=511662 RepID=A0ABX0U305_9SPHN|nr:hypothetical protein [Sphingomonas japonica]